MRGLMVRGAAMHRHCECKSLIHRSRRLQSPDSRRLQSPDSRRLQSPGSRRLQSPGSRRLQSPGSRRLQSPGSRRLQSPGSRRLQSPGSRRLQQCNCLRSHVQHRVCQPRQTQKATLKQKSFIWNRIIVIWDLQNQIVTQRVS